MVLQPFWHAVTRLGEIQIVLPAGMIAALVLVLRHGAWRLAVSWMSWLVVAMLLTLASKLVFIGWGMGYAPLDFTGVSGHAMLSAALFPLTVAALSPTRSRHGRWGAAGMGMALALLIGVSRIVVGAHSWSEVLAGWLLGSLVTVFVLSRYGIPPARSSRWSALAWLPPVVCVLFVWLTLVWSSSFNSHRVITHFSLALTGHAGPYTRADMVRDSRRRSAVRGRPDSS